ncbi:MAG: DNA-processing protein DprA [candidate division WOR-3 bacterium]
MFDEKFLRHLKEQITLYNLPDSTYEKSLKFLEKEDVEILESEKFFRKRVENFPEYLFVLGNKENLKKFKIGIVGTRKPDSYGIKGVKDIVEGYKNKDVVTVSGFAQGIDSLVHRESIQKGIGTVAVLPCGFGINYPVSNTKLKDEIKKNGLLISEYSPFIKPYKHNFIKRNFIISVISDILIIIQGAVKSGTLSTFLFSLKLKKQIFALPGEITNKLSYAPNYAIFKGAIPLYSLEILPGVSKQKKIEIETILSDDEKKVVELIKKYGNLENILKTEGFEKSRILSLLTTLEMKGIINKTFNNRITVTEDFDGTDNTTG